MFDWIVVNQIEWIVIEDFDSLSNFHDVLLSDRLNKHDELDGSIPVNSGSITINSSPFWINSSRFQSILDKFKSILDQFWINSSEFSFSIGPLMVSRLVKSYLQGHFGFTWTSFPIGSLMIGRLVIDNLQGYFLA
jgi:hypothetical protein